MQQLLDKMSPQFPTKHGVCIHKCTAEIRNHNKTNKKSLSTMHFTVTLCYKTLFN